ncbi:HEAT repeat-containing protein 3 [Maniola hyperantus]|uniref:HEAT repeat-containing protein 3 n=1 Tax=Aphantopus hyperantus TaxID=2795564 RepID=UPI0015688265|nr:HEAT repeat-containing protein 3 [Maniola hyperantus]
MGKVRKRKPKPNKIVNNEAATNSDEEELPLDSKENAIQTIIDQLQAANVEEKYCGLQTFAMLLDSQESLEQMINRGLVKMVAPLLLDAASSVRNAAAGSLRNLSAVGHQMCDVLMEHDVMTSLVFYYHQYTETWVPDTSSKNKDDSDTFVQCTNLLLNLCESSELAVKYCGDSKILDIFPRYLDISTFGVDIVTAIMQCWFVVVEDNPSAIEKIKNSSERQLKELLLLEANDPSALLIKTLAGGVIINMCGGNISSLPLDVMNQIIAVLAKTLSLDHRLACNQLSSNVPLSNAAGKVIPPKGKEGQVLESQLKSVIQILDAQQSAIEIIANICSCDDSDDSIEGPESSDSDEPLDEEICSNGEGVLLAEDRLPPELLEALISLEIFDKVWARTQLPPENVMPILKEYEGSQPIYKKLHNLQTRALLCINNMLLSLPIENLGGVNGVYKIWVDAGKLVFKQNSENLNLLESATAVMRAALDKIKLKDNEKPTDCNLFSDLALSDIEIMLTGIRDCQEAEIRSNLIRMIGILALLLVNNLNETTSTVICTITDFILEQAHKENDVWVLAEAIDTLVDLYSEDETDLLAAKVKLVEKLSVLAPIFKNKARQQKKLPKEYKVLVTTANSNLPRFIKYKKARLSKLC